MNLTDLELLNQCSDFMYQNGVTITPIIFQEASELQKTNHELVVLSDRLHLDPAWGEFCRLNRSLYYRLAGGICPPSHVIQGMEKELSAGYSAIRHAVNGVSAEVRETLDRIVNRETGSWARLARIEASPFYSVVCKKINEAINRRQTSIVFVLRDNRFREQTINLLMAFQSSINIAVRKSNELRNHPRVDRVFYVGSIRSLTRLDEEFLLRAPITDEFDFLELSPTGSIQNVRLDAFALDPGTSFPLNRAPAIGIIDRVNSKTTTHVADEEFEGDLSPDPDEIYLNGESARSVDAFRAILGGGFGVHLGAESESKVFIAHCRNQGISIICNKIEKKSVIDLEPGDFVVLTTEGSGDMIAPYADQQIGPNAQTYRELQKAWKRDLADLVNNTGSANVLEKLGAESGFDVSASNLRQWLGPTIHGPGEERPLLFDAVLRLLGRDDKTELHKEALAQIREASISAGHHLQTELRKELVGMDLAPVLSSGYMVVRLEENGPAKTIFELQKLDPVVHSVNPHYINHVFRRKHGEQDR